MFVNRSRAFWMLSWVGCIACEGAAPSGNAVPAQVSSDRGSPRVAEVETQDVIAEAPALAIPDSAPSSVEAPAAKGGAMTATPVASPAPAAAAQSGPGAAAGQGDTPLSKVHARAERGGALTEAYAGLARGEKQRISELVAAIDEQAAADPDDRYAVFYAGVFRLWRLAEGELTLESLLGALTNVEDMLENLERAHALIPDDFRVTAFFGLAQVLIGGLMGDDALLDAGMKTLEHAVEQHAPYGRFLRATGVSVLPRDHKYFHYALDDMAAGTVDCNFPSGRDGAAYEYPPDDQPRSRVCLNKSVVPHVWEGTFLSYGDMALKAGWDAERVRALYRSAMTAPTYEDWAFRELLEQRIADTDKRVAAYADDDPINDPTVWGADGNICAGCHKDMASLIAR